MRDRCRYALSSIATAVVDVRSRILALGHGGGDGGMEKERIPSFEPLQRARAKLRPPR